MKTPETYSLAKTEINNDKDCPFCKNELKDKHNGKFECNGCGKIFIKFHTSKGGKDCFFLQEAENN